MVRVLIHYGANKFNPELIEPIKYEAIWLTAKGQSETHYSNPTNLYGWDCESVLIMNSKCVIPID